MHQGQLSQTREDSSRDIVANAQSLQEAAHGEDHDYIAGSPHLKHADLHERLAWLLRDAVSRVNARGLPLSVLEVGAGHGGFTESALALGCAVTATEMSRPSLERMLEKFGVNHRFQAVFDPDGSLSVLGDRTFSLMVCASVLHHIPDYTLFLQNALSRMLNPGGSLVILQDPMWHSDMSRSTRLLDRVAYFTWRLSQGNYRQGLQTRLRRLRGVYDEGRPADMAEYHVVRHGVDQNTLIAVLARQFEQVRPMLYWAAQSTLWQKVGEMCKARNTFALVADGFIG